MVTLQELCEYLEQLLDSQSFSDYSENGIQVEGAQTVGKIATAVTANLATIKAAAALGIHALIVHHGMFWRSDSYRITGVKKEKLDWLFKHNMSLIAYHLPLDAHQELGNNWKAARDMGWMNRQPFGILNGKMLGVKGCFPKMPRSDFQKKLEDYYQHPSHCALGGKEVIETAALVSGGAYKMLPEAVKEGVDCFITGSFDLPVWDQAHEEGINFFALGHAATETVGPRALGEHLSSLYHTECRFLDIPNPF